MKPEPAAVNPRAAKATALTGYVNDFAGVLAPATVANLGASLAQFEKETSNQIALAGYPQLPEGAVEDFTIDVAERSRLGRKGLDNGAILSIFAKDGVARLEVGYGLEGTLTDIQAHRLLENVLVPSWKAGDRDQAVVNVLVAITTLVRDDYRAGKMPGRVAIFWRQATVEIPKLARNALPTLMAVPLDGRIGIAFFGGLLFIGFWDAFVQARASMRNIAITIGNLRAGKAMSAGTATVDLGSVIDALKVVGIVIFGLATAVGVVVIAGGGAFGSAGSTLRW
jgi:uncharacterized membrane protein YgcG